MRSAAEPPSAAAGARQPAAPPPDPAAAGARQPAARPPDSAAAGAWKPAAAPPGPGDGAPQLIATDLDGTLLDAQGRVSRRTQEALAAVWERGITTVFVTARPPRWLHPLVEAVGAHGIAICANGAFVYAVDERRIVSATGIDAEVVREVVADVRREIPSAGFAAERTTGVHADDAFLSLRAYSEVQEAHTDTIEVRGPIDTVTGTIGKLLVRAPELIAAGEREDSVQAVADIVGERASVQFSGAVGLAEIGPLGVTKASTLAAWCRERGIPAASVWAFGDMPNDLPMLTWAGRSFAVANAHPEVLATATDRTGHHDSDGVAQVLETLL